MSGNAGTQEVFMQRALDLARRAWGQTHPNPMVGAVIVEHGEVVAEGWHRAAGQAHAEVEALTSLARAPREGAELYVTLEPCSTHGRTGACTEAVLKAGIRKVYIGTLDPNPTHAGRGVDILREGGVEVVVGVLERACADLNLIFNHWIVNGTPFLAAKMATTLDGKFAAASGHSKWVTGESARKDVMRWRRYFPAIGVGANTVARDDPQLTSRLEGDVWCPRRFVFDRDLRTAALAEVPQLYRDAPRDKTVVVCSDGAPDVHRRTLVEEGITLWEFPELDGGLDWGAFRRRCAEEGITGVYIETGPGLATSLIEGHEVDYVFIYQAPKFLGDSGSKGMGSARRTKNMNEAITLQKIEHAVFGDDILIRGRLR